MTRIAYANPDLVDGALAAKFVELVDDPPWPWLESSQHLVPWASTVDALDLARDEMKQVFGAVPSVVNRVLDRTFCATVARNKKIDPGFSELVREARTSTSDVEAAVAQWPEWARARFAFVVRQGHHDRAVAGERGVFRFTNPEGLLIFNVNSGGIVEPRPAVVRNFSSAWFIDGHGEPHLLGFILVDDRELQFTRTDVGFVSDEISGAEEAIERARVVVESASKLDYRGPCAVEGYRYRIDVERGDVELRAAARFRPRFTAAHVAVGLAQRANAPLGARFRFDVNEAKLEIRS
jgi:hypothetical protein